MYSFVLVLIIYPFCSLDAIYSWKKFREHQPLIFVEDASSGGFEFSDNETRLCEGRLNYRRITTKMSLFPMFLRLSMDNERNCALLCYTIKICSWANFLNDGFCELMSIKLDDPDSNVDFNETLISYTSSNTLTNIDCIEEEFVPLIVVSISRVKRASNSFDLVQWIKDNFAVVLSDVDFTIQFPTAKPTSSSKVHNELTIDLAPTKAPPIDNFNIVTTSSSNTDSILEYGVYSTVNIHCIACAANLNSSFSEINGNHRANKTTVDYRNSTNNCTIMLQNYTSTNYSNNINSNFSRLNTTSIYNFWLNNYTDPHIFFNDSSDTNETYGLRSGGQKNSNSADKTTTSILDKLILSSTVSSTAIIQIKNLTNGWINFVTEPPPGR
uniref:Apple domain-containing protein n=1 Tax=Romanomermis culicivorax TaxID=13658 RepID=A0A915KAK9_ROMCU